MFDRVVAGIAANAEKIKLGIGMDPQTEMGPMVSEVQHGRVKGYLKAGLEEGARAVTGGWALEGKGYFVKPTVLVDTNAEHESGARGNLRAGGGGHAVQGG